MLTGEAMVRSARKRTAMLAAAVLATCGVGVAVATISPGGAQPPAHALRPRLLPTAITPQAGACFVAGGSPCSLTPCTQYVARTPADDRDPKANGLPSRHHRLATGRACSAYPHVRPTPPVFIDG